MKLTSRQKTDLIKAAKEGMMHAFTATNQPQDPRFGAAVLTSAGNIYSSGQYFSNTLSLTLHAEQGAIAHAAAHGEYGIVALACLGNAVAYKMSGGIIFPCHLCKQVLWESYLRSSLNTIIYIVDSQWKITEKFLLVEAMSKPWPLPTARI